MDVLELDQPLKIFYLLPFVRTNINLRPTVDDLEYLGGCCASAGDALKVRQSSAKARGSSEGP